ncbi:unnamed protein product [Didymodactylos carnosus]|uniref:Uncharacterized protein n=1 Tax=Didymodactylos carnosus TaxID=1234261 RepID=A0A814GKU4_9BILA|nr:unnamed protein product [Didymodactylos carnosus]CAF3769240.1 unnamed protein product [Didymodactylos carnosus]
MFHKQVSECLADICHLFQSCANGYALHRTDDGHFVQLKFGVDLIRAYASTKSEKSKSALLNLFVQHLVRFEEKVGTKMKSFIYLMHDLFDELEKHDYSDRRHLLSKLHDQMLTIHYPSCTGDDKSVYENLISHILSSLPNFDRKDYYKKLILNLIRKSEFHLDNYIRYIHQLSHVTVGLPITKSHFMDGILIPVQTQTKLKSLSSDNSQVNILFLNLKSDHQSQFYFSNESSSFYSYDTELYRRFTQYIKSKYAINLILSSAFINETFMHELYSQQVNVIDSIDNETFDFLLDVYQCVPISDLNDVIDGEVRSVTLIQRNLTINQQCYIHLSCDSKYQTLISCVQTPTMVLTTQKAFLNLLRLLRFVGNSDNRTAKRVIDVYKAY